MIKAAPNHELLAAWLENSTFRQVDLAQKLGVTRQAVSRWCAGVASPSRPAARVIEELTGGEVLAAGWPGRRWTTGKTRAGEAISKIIAASGSNVAAFARRCNLPQRSFARYIAGDSPPRPESVRLINKALGTKFTRWDFVEPSL